MQVSPFGSSPVDTLPSAASAAVVANGNVAKEAGGMPSVAATAPAAQVPASVAQEGDRVTLSRSGAAATQTPMPAPVYAEIWKDGLRVAVVDSQGSVVSLNGLLASSPMGSSGGGPELAARRAMQIAHAVGGEIRVAGQTLDAPTLTMRAKLKAAYGA